MLSDERKKQQDIYQKLRERIKEIINTMKSTEVLNPRRSECARLAT